MALYEKVLHNTIGETVNTLVTAVNAGSGPVEKLKIYVRCLLGVIRNNPQIPSIILRELAGGARHLPDLVVRDFIGMFDLLTGILEEGVDADVFRSKAPVLVHFMVVGPAIFHPRISELQDRFVGLLGSSLLEKNFNIDLETEIEQLVTRAVMKTESEKEVNE